MGLSSLQAIENGDAVTLGQAWRDVRSGNVKPDDIDTLNALLKSVSWSFITLQDLSTVYRGVYAADRCDSWHWCLLSI